MNFLKKGFLSLSLMLAGTLVGSNTEVSIKNESGYKLELKNVLFYYPDGTERFQTLTIGKDKTVNFDPWLRGELIFEYLQIMNSPEKTILTKRKLEDNPDEIALIITIKPGWLFGGWDVTQQWQKDPSEEDFTEL